MFFVSIYTDEVKIRSLFIFDFNGIPENFTMLR